AHWCAAAGYSQLYLSPSRMLAPGSFCNPEIGTYFIHERAHVAGFLSGDRAAYRYLSNSLTGHPDADGLARILRDAGLRDVSFRRLGFGSVALHTGIK
ncbi:MAG: class I SAM-dependent methyltransferase, partial [Chloroflexi bacterium]|nr:class I SAM-dependent methyltransferase [Chloroflexota bacterium]